MYRLSGKLNNFIQKVVHFPDSLETFRTVWKLSRQSINCPETANCLRNIGKVWLLFGKSGYYLESLVTVWTVWKKFGQYGNCPDSQKLSRESGNLNYKLSNIF